MLAHSRTRHFRNGRRLGRGFSLLEALIAVVVLSTGLLALAALQSALIRSSADARIRSMAAARATSVMEEYRARAADGGYAGLIDTPLTNVDVTGSLPPAAAGEDLVTFTATASATRYRDEPGLLPDTRVWNPVGPVSANPVANVFKRDVAEFLSFDITVAWGDPYNPGQTRQVVLSDVIGPASSQFLNPEVDLETEEPIGGPVVRTLTPEGPGVIPIAIGGGEDTAATNPKPIIVGQGPNAGAIIETRFDVLNFSSGGEDANIVRIQKRVETSVAACRCTLGTSPGTTSTIIGAARRPTFWDGVSYVPPALTGAEGLAGPSSSATVQSDLCTECCRDHHDPTGVAGPKFDPFRTDHEHFFNLDPNDLANATPVSTGGDYDEVCRLIRVDGLWRVAADFDSRFFGLLETKTLSLQSDNSEPKPEAATAYEGFVIDALEAEFATLTPTVDRDTDLKPAYGLATLNDPLDIFINRPASGPIDFRFLHARGFYVDHIEEDARKLINEARDNCLGPDPLPDCTLRILQFVPFTTINVTELAKWQPEASPPGVQVTNASGIIFGDPTAPIRGQVNALASGPDLDNVLTSNSRSNTGLVATNLFVDPQDVLEAQDDFQTFSMPASGAPGDPFQVELFSNQSGVLPQISDSNTSNDPKVAWLIGIQGNNCPGDFTGPGKDNNPNPYQCTTFSSLSGIDVDVRVRDYNRVRTTSISNPCGGGKNVDQPVCENYRIDKLIVGTNEPIPVITVTGNNTLGETSTVRVPGVTAGVLVRLRFALESTTAATHECPIGSSQPVWNDCFSGP